MRLRRTAAPVSSVVAGIPLMLLAGCLLARGRPKRAALLAAGAAALVYILIDLAILLGAGAAGGIWGMGGALPRDQAGGRAGRGRRSPPAGPRPTGVRT